MLENANKYATGAVNALWTGRMPLPCPLNYCYILNPGRMVLVVLIAFFTKDKILRI